ncbi:hypothetical protein HZB94_02440 [Candidatus Falkowbacteria bacterium]|nr:hypothetical protein [Candidatus Falkowbacteria bacterium]
MDECEVCRATISKWARGNASIADLLEDKVTEHLKICTVCFQFLFSQLAIIADCAIMPAPPGTLCNQYRQVLFGIAHGQELFGEKAGNLARVHSLLCEPCGQYFFEECEKDETIEVPPLPQKVLEALLDAGTDLPEEAS